MMHIMLYSHNLCGRRKSTIETQDRAADFDPRSEMGSLDHGLLRRKRFSLSMESTQRILLHPGFPYSLADGPAAYNWWFEIAMLGPSYSLHVRNVLPKSRRVVWLSGSSKHASAKTPNSMPR